MSSQRRAMFRKNSDLLANYKLNNDQIPTRRPKLGSGPPRFLSLAHRAGADHPEYVFPGGSARSTPPNETQSPSLRISRSYGFGIARSGGNGSVRWLLATLVRAPAASTMGGWDDVRSVGSALPFWGRRNTLRPLGAGPTYAGGASANLPERAPRQQLTIAVVWLSRVA
jgi:hypothetical protein